MATSTNGSSKVEPNWSRFGLDGEKQPLNPGGVLPTTGGATDTNLLASQVQNDNELFANDLVS